MYANIRIQARGRAHVATRAASAGEWQPAGMPDVNDVVAFGAIVLFCLTLLFYAAVMSGAL